MLTAIGLTKKVGHTYKYYLTDTGRRIILTALKLRELVVIPSLAAALPAQPWSHAHFGISFTR